MRSEKCTRWSPTLPADPFEGFVASIAFVMGGELSHLRATGFLVRWLRARGHDVRYLGYAWQEPLYRSQDLPFEPFFPELRSGIPSASEIFPRLLDSERLLSGSFRPDSVIVDAAIPYIALAVHKAKRRVAVVTTTLPVTRDLELPPLTSGIIPDGTPGCRLKTKLVWSRHLLLDKKLRVLRRWEYPVFHIRRFAAACGYPPSRVNGETTFGVKLDFPELILCPAEFDFPRPPALERLYLGPCVDLSRPEPAFPWELLDQRPLVYCAIGTILSRSHATHGLLEKIVRAAAALPDLQFVFAAGATWKDGAPGSKPANVLVVREAPQLALLRRAALMITHGGFNTVKECILMGAPMIALPSKNFRDHFSSAERVVYHGLGLQRDIAEVSSTELISLIDQILNDQSFKLRVDLMREKFLQQDRFDIAIKVIENSISGKYCASK